MVTDAAGSDEQLMIAYRDGDAGAFDTLYRRHKGGVYRYMLRQCRDAGVADELFQDVWMNLIQARERYRVEARFRTYLFTLAHNKLMDYFRRYGRVELTLYEHDGEEGRESAVDRLVASRVDEPLVRAESQQQSAAILRAIECLPAPQREAFLLHEEGQLSIEDIALATGCTFEAAKSRLRYAIAKLREGLKEYA